MPSIFRCEWGDIRYPQSPSNLFWHSTGLGLGPLVTVKGHIAGASFQHHGATGRHYRLLFSGMDALWCEAINSNLNTLGIIHRSLLYCSWSKTIPVCMLKSRSLHSVGWNAIHLQNYWKVVASCKSSVTCQVKSNYEPVDRSIWRMLQFDLDMCGCVAIQKNCIYSWEQEL